jgi:hypothetical protein
MQSFLSTVGHLISTFTIRLGQKGPITPKNGELLMVICYFYPPQKGNL